jgi:hypothetical protein
MRAIHRRALMTALLLIACAIDVSAQSRTRHVRVALYTTDGSGVSGEIRTIDERDVVLIRADSSDLVVPLERVGVAAIITSRRSELGTLMALTGTYAGIAMWGVDPANGLYLDDGWEPALAAIVGSMAGGLAGLIAQPRRLDDRAEYRLVDSASRARFVADVRQALVPRSQWILGLYGGLVACSDIDERRRQFYIAGYTEHNPNGTSVAMLRRVELARTVAGGLDAAALFVSLSQPDVDMIVWPAMRVVETHRGAAGMLGVRYRLAFSSRPEAPVVRLGLAAGVASAEATRFGHRTGGATMVAGLGSVELTTPLSDWIVVGVSAETLVVPSFEVEGNPVLAIPTQPVDLSSTCIGFTLGTTF